MNGFLVIDKSSGMTSYDVIRRLKKIHSFKKIGYIGTLDRNAKGVLPVALNEGVKLIPFLENVEKVYRARFLLGTTTDTYDIEGKIISTKDVENFEIDRLKQLLNSFKGKIIQEIPIFSSKKINRKPLYKLARKGVPVEPQQKEVEIYDIILMDYSSPYIDVEVTCSKGTYIRSLAHDFGQKLGCGATLFSLKRTRHGEFFETMAISLDYLKMEQDLITYIMPLENIMKSIREITVDIALERFLKHGMPIPLFGHTKEWKQDELTKLLNNKGILIGIGQADTISKTIKIKRLINN
ncbi:MAG TPA: tRNA pseudouridine(55) synthase TruB [Deltaproteobacteria bacterium]|nr:tRNA pseudouridine(55) synthase TruB [Deltaproteobacteria bacterium]